LREKNGTTPDRDRKKSIGAGGSKRNGVYKERPRSNNKDERTSPGDSKRPERVKKSDFFTREAGDRPRSKTFVDYNENLVLEGRNALMEALKADKPIDKIYIKKGPVEGTITVIVAKAREKGIVISEVAKEKLDYMSRSGNHQGVIAICPAHEYVEVSDILNIAAKKGEDPFIIILDSITDPHNLGAIMRTAECSGAHGIIIPKRRSVTLTGIVSKTSAGAIEYVPVARVTNLNQTIDELKQKGIWICCADTHGRPLFNADLSGPVAIVIGAEGEGISKLISKKSDFAVKVPMYGKISSLNASVAASLVMYEVIRQRNFKGE
jgi:23S rRNA (guanosine2251-2'-O)-methyltransferase